MMLDLMIATNTDLYIFAITLSDNVNDDVIPVSEVTSLPVFTDLSEDRCGAADSLSFSSKW